MASTVSGASGGGLKSRDHDDLWRSAYRRMRRGPDNKKLLVKFQKVVQEEMGEGQSPKGHLSSEEGRKSLLKLINNKAQRLSTDSGPLSKVIQAILKTKDVVATGAAASPPAAVAVAGLFIAISMGQNYLRENRAMAECTELIAKVIRRRAVEDSQVRSTSPLEAARLKELREQLRCSYLDLYSQLLVTITRLVVKLDSGLRRWADNVFGWTDWVAQRRDLDDAERECERDLEVIHRYNSDPYSQALPFHNKGRNRLHWNAKLGNSGLVAELVQSNAFDVNARTAHGWTALSLAAEEGHLQCCRNILPVRGLDKNSQNNRGHTALHIAARKDHADVVKLLLSESLDVNKPDNNGWTALHSAADLGRLAAIKVLRNARGISLTAQDHEGRTALHLAAIKNKVKVVKALAEKLQDVDCQDNKGRTPLLDAAEKGYTDVVKSLLARGAAVDQVTKKNRWTALHICAAGGHLECLKALLDSSSFALNKQNRQGHTPLQEAVLTTRVAIVKELCQRGATVDIRSVTKRTAFLDASKIGRLNMVKQLRGAGADLNQVSGRNGWSALHEAVNANKVGVAKYLVQEGIRQDIKITGGTQRGKTARQLAEAKNNAALLEILSTAGNGTT